MNDASALKITAALVSLFQKNVLERDELDHAMGASLVLFPMLDLLRNGQHFSLEEVEAFKLIRFTAGDVVFETNDMIAGFITLALRTGSIGVHCDPTNYVPGCVTTIAGGHIEPEDLEQLLQVIPFDDYDLKYIMDEINRKKEEGK